MRPSTSVHIRRVLFEVCWAEMKLAEEYDAAQDRGEVAKNGHNQHSDEGVVASNTLGLRRDEIHAARKLRDAERDEPGIIQRSINEIVEQGEEPDLVTGHNEVPGIHGKR